MKIVHLIYHLFIIVALSYLFSLHPILAGLIGFGVGIEYVKTKDQK